MIRKELALQEDFLGAEAVIHTIYFGGGTPSLLSIVELGEILETVHQHYKLDLKELTIETNPDDLDRDKLSALRELGFDRLSIGIQSFDEEVLKFYNRAHSAKESLSAIEKAQDAGFAKLSIDLLFGFPQPDHDLWKRDLDKAIEFNPGHISSYALTIEPNTALWKWTERQSFVPASEDFVAEQFEIMQSALGQAGYVQYEISNFGKPDAFAIHNTNYWTGIPYLGIGPSAHSFDGKKRLHNPSNNIKYVKALEKGNLPYSSEELNDEEALNEYILTSLRTIWGTDTTHIQHKFNKDILIAKREEILELEQQGWMEVSDQRLILTQKGKLLADGIALKLFF